MSNGSYITYLMYGNLNISTKNIPKNMKPLIVRQFLM